MTIRETAAPVLEACGCQVELLDRGDFRVGDIYTCVADLAKSRRELAYEPRVLLRQGLQEFIQWAKKAQQPNGGYENASAELEQFGLMGAVRRPVEDG